MSKLGATALAIAIGYLLFRLLVGSAKLLYLICKMAVLLPIALFALATGAASIHVSREKPLTASPAIPARKPAAHTANPAPATARPDEPLPVATQQSTGDWKQDQETLRRLLAEGQIKTTPKG